MKQPTLRNLAIIQFFVTANTGLLFAQADASMTAVTCRTNTTLLQSDSEWKPLTHEMTMPGGIKVFTNATFHVNNGKKRHLKEGQILRSDGTLLNPDGSIMPVFDHVAMSKGTVMVFQDGEGEALTSPMALRDGSVINPDGSYSRPSGRYSRLVDGQCVTLDGASLPALDTITFSNGKVVVYKSGALISLQSAGQIMGMNDGTRVRGDGLVTSPNGATLQLTEGQTITVEGPRTNW